MNKFQGRHSGTEHTILAALERRHSLLETFARRVAGPRVFVALDTHRIAIENSSVRRFLMFDSSLESPNLVNTRSLLLERRRQRDGRDHGSGDLIGLLTGMNGKSAEFEGGMGRSVRGHCEVRGRDEFGLEPDEPGTLDETIT